MSPEQTLQILRARLATNAAARTAAADRGDLALVAHYDADTATTLESIARLEAADG
ncbi:MAG: hypothetical protein ACK52I_12205 [Pseudomonadota bacterium]|jgi:hypothetical protein